METTTPSARVTLWSIAALLLLFGCALRIVAVDFIQRHVV
jgi:hypothetical protein